MGDPRVVLRSSTAHRVERRLVQPELHGVELVFLSPSVDLDHVRRRRHRQLVHAVARMKDDGPLHAEAPQHVRHLGRELGVGDAEGLVLRPGRVAQRAQDVENAPNGELPTRGASETKRRMEDRREQEADAHLVDAPRDAFGLQVDLDPQLLEHVRRAAK